ncbi:unnamed protein product [Closterium sp. Naga37s-1]|nr:unnamed protein product [Closterium sp. Naga37s-1]
MAPSPLAMAPRDLPPLTAASVPCCNMVGEGVARGGSSCLRALQSSGGEAICHPPAADAAVGGGDLQHQPPPAPPFSSISLLRVQQWGEGMAVAGVANLLSPERLLHRPFSYLPPAAGAAVGGEGICSTSPPPPPPFLLSPPAAGAAVGGRGSAAPTPPPPPPFSSIPCCRCSSGGGYCYSHNRLECA